MQDKSAGWPGKCALIFVILLSFNNRIFCQSGNKLSSYGGGEDKITDSYVNAIIQDKTGFIWLGTEDGLIRYDGYTSIVYRHKNNEPNSIADNEIFTLCTDDENGLWVGTIHGLSRFDITNESFENFYYDSAKPQSLANNQVFGLAKDSHGNIWVATFGGGLDMVKKEGNTYLFTHHRNNRNDSNSLSSDQTFGVYFDKPGNAWIATENGLNYYNVSEKKFKRFYHDSTNANSISRNSIYKCFIADDNAIWIMGRSLLDRIKFPTANNNTSPVVEHYLPQIAGNDSLSNWSINAFLLDKNSTTWIATNDQGLLKFSIKNLQKPGYYKDRIEKKYLLKNVSGDSYFSIFQDRSGVIWMGTEKGVLKYIPSKRSFDEFDVTEVNLLNKNINALLTDDENNLLVGYDSDTIILRRNEEPRTINKIKLPGTSKNIPDQVNTLYKSSNGDIYVGTMRQGVFIIPKESNIYDYSNKWLHIDKTTFTQLQTNNIYSFIEDQNGLIWIGTYKGLHKYNPVSKRLDTCYVPPDKKVTSAYIIRSMLIDSKNQLWCGTDDGLYIFSNNRLTNAYKNNALDSTSINNDRVTGLYLDNKKNIWVYTKSGIDLYDETKGFIHFKPLSQFPQESIKFFRQDDRNNIWVGTNHGLFKYDPNKKTIYSYTIADGLCSNDFVANSMSKDLNGIFYFGTNKGIVSFDPRNITPNDFPPPVVITNTKVLNKEIALLNDITLLNTFKKEKRLILKYNQNFFSFEFAALNYINSSENKYAYQLEGIDKEWIQSGTKRFADYTDIKPGTYTFKVKASNNDGVWNEVPATIEVIVLSPWWQTWWFYSLCAIAFCTAVYTIYRIRLNQILKLYKLRSTIAKDLHDDVGSALSSIALLSNIAQEGKTNTQLNSGEIFSRIGNTSKKMIDLMDDIVWSVNPDNDRFSNMLIRMREYAVEMLEAKNISFNFLAGNIDDLKIPMHMRKDYFLIFKEAINNLAKYSNAKNATITIQHASRNLCTIIKDDGKGFNSSIINSGNGLINMKQRAATLNGKLIIETEINNGTCITLNIPVP